MYIIGNWKMNPENKLKAKIILDKINEGMEKIDIKKKKIVICPGFLHLNLMSQNSKIILGAQNLFFEKEGSFTGEISATQLKDFGVKYVIIGHAERRDIFSETDEIVNKKVKIALKNDLIPIFCIGEKLDEKREGQTVKILEKQIKNGLKEIILNKKAKIIVAYEPVWTIGTGLIPTYDEVLEIKKEIKKILNNLNFDFPIVYGGSVSKNNIQGFIQKSKINGLLIGRSSLNPSDFIQIIKNI